MRVAVFVGPVIAFIITRRWCISLQRDDDDRLLHGYETGIIMRSPEGGYSERHLPIAGGRGLHAHRARPRRRSTTPDSERRRQRRGRAAAVALDAAPGPALAGVVRRQRPEADRARSSTTAHHHAEHEHELQARAGPRGRRSPVRRPPHRRRGGAARLRSTDPPARRRRRTSRSGAGRRVVRHADVRSAVPLVRRGGGDLDQAGPLQDRAGELGGVALDQASCPSPSAERARAAVRAR